MKSTIIVLIIIIMAYYWDSIWTRKRQCNAIDGHCYDISTKYDKETHAKASELLAHLNKFSIKVLRHMRHKYLWDTNPRDAYRRNMTIHLLNNYNPDSIIENTPLSSVNTSYVENKGMVYAICLREKKTGKNLLHNPHIIEYVVLHEMAHMSTAVVGHDDPEFWINFKILIQEAHELGIHTPIDYKKYPENYCGLNVAYSPYFDDRFPFK